jgi:hypothetical protein
MGDHTPSGLPSGAGLLSFARRSFSVWTDRGLPDHSCTIHSAGVTMWTALGLREGFCAFSEMPAPARGPFGLVGLDVRSDSAWLETDTGSPRVLVEFERYSGDADEAKLVQKVDNLLLAHHRWGGATGAVVLAYWSKGLADLPRHEALRRRFRGGFRTPAMERVEGVAGPEVHFLHFILREGSSGNWRLWRVEERGMV